MRIEQQFLEQSDGLLATHLPDGSDGDNAVSQWRGETGQVQERVGHAHQTPMFLNGCGAAHAVRVQAQMSLTVLVKGFGGPTQQIGGDDPLRWALHSRWLVTSTT